jgi:hypothetical protein
MFREEVYTLLRSATVHPRIIESEAKMRGKGVWVK